MGVSCQDNEPIIGKAVEPNGKETSFPLPSDEELRAARAALLVTTRLMTTVTAAYVQDRSEQYLNSSGCRIALGDVAANIRKNEHLDAFRHGELDELLEEV
jgi:hypothetical protein